MRCLYDVLGVSNDADDTQLKKAYRQAALQWHPDKNQDRQQEAELRFKEIQNAYEILSDKHERAWYDSHRSQILRADGNYQAGGGAFSADEAGQPPEDLSLYQYFSSSCYDDYNDGPKGFYTVYRGVFEGLLQKEVEAAERAAKKGPAPTGFGRADSPWAEVSAFYQYWLQFVSDRHFAWADAHNLASAPNRKVRRLMEEDNKKRRRAARRDFQDNVRELVAFVRKRDRRVIAWQQQQELEKQQRLAAEEQRKEQERQQRIQRAMEYQDAAWVDEGADGEGSQEEEAAFVEDELCCVACDKFFKSANAMANHEKSKKHLERAEALRAAMLEEEDVLSPIAESDGELDIPSTDKNSLDEHSASEAEQSASGRSDDDIIPAAVPTNDTDSRHKPSSGGAVDSLEQILADLDRGKADVQRSASGHEDEIAESESLSEAESEASDESLDEDAMLARMVKAHARVSKPSVKPRRNPVTQEVDNTNGKVAVSRQPEPASEGPDDIAAKDAVSVNDAGREVYPSSMAQSKGDAAEEPVGEEPQQAPDDRKPSKAPKSRKDKRKAKEAAASEKGLMCTVCRAQFDTRNQLFKHISERGHAHLKA